MLHVWEASLARATRNAHGRPSDQSPASYLSGSTNNWGGGRRTPSTALLRAGVTPPVRRRRGRQEPRSRPRPNAKRSQPLPDAPPEGSRERPLPIVQSGAQARSSLRALSGTPAKAVRPCGPVPLPRAQHNGGRSERARIREWAVGTNDHGQWRGHGIHPATSSSGRRALHAMTPSLRRAPARERSIAATAAPGSSSTRL
jgi:hypothetical protein